MDRLLWQNRTLLVLFTRLRGLVLSYRMTVNLSILWKCMESYSRCSKGWPAKNINVSVIFFIGLPSMP